MTITEIASFIKEYGAGWEKELINFEKFDVSLSNEIAEFPYAKIFRWIEKEKFNIDSVEEIVTPKMFKEDVQIQFEKLAFSLGVCVKSKHLVVLPKLFGDGTK
jgi:hypothetical protein